MSATPPVEDDLARDFLRYTLESARSDALQSRISQQTIYQWGGATSAAFFAGGLFMLSSSNFGSRTSWDGWSVLTLLAVFSAPAAMAGLANLTLLGEIARMTRACRTLRAYESALIDSCVLPTSRGPLRLVGHELVTRLGYSLEGKGFESKRYYIGYVGPFTIVMALSPVFGALVTHPAAFFDRHPNAQVGMWLAAGAWVVVSLLAIGAPSWKISHVAKQLPALGDLHERARLLVHGTIWDARGSSGETHGSTPRMATDGAAGETTGDTRLP